MAESISDILLERYLAADVTPAQKQRIEAALADPLVAARLAALKLEREQFYAARSSDVMARAIAVRAAEQSVRQKLGSRPRWWAWLTPALATAAGVVLVFKMWSTFETPQAPVPPASVAPVVAATPKEELAAPPAANFAQPPPLAQAPLGRISSGSFAKAKKASRGGEGAALGDAKGGDKVAVLVMDDEFAAKEKGEEPAKTASRFATPPPGSPAQRDAPAAAPKPTAHASAERSRAALDESQAEPSPPSAAQPRPAPPSAQAFDGAASSGAANKQRRAASGSFAFGQNSARAGTTISYRVDAGGFSVVISLRDDAPPKLLADNSQHAVTRGRFVLAPASVARHERVLLFVFNEPFNAGEALAAVNANQAAATLELTVQP